MPCIFTCFKGAGVHAVMGIGAAPEGVISAAAIKLLGGGMQAVFKPKTTPGPPKLTLWEFSLTRSIQLRPRARRKSDFLRHSGHTNPDDYQAVLEGVSFFPGGSKNPQPGGFPTHS
jgi:fructose-1,6-bisphosphatase II